MGIASKQSAARIEKRFLMPLAPSDSDGDFLSAVLDTKMQPLCNLPPARRTLKMLEMAGDRWAALNLLKTLGQQVAEAARHAYWMRRMDAVEAAAEVLSALAPFGHNAVLGEYFRALCLKRQGAAAAAGRTFERLVDAAPDGWRNQVLLSAGAVRYDMGDYDAAIRYYVETARVAAGKDWAAAIWAHRMIAQIKVLTGDVRRGADDFDRLLKPAMLLWRVNPCLLYDFLNAHAYALTLAGRSTEARDMCKVILSSPCASVYPEWRETALDAGLYLVEESRPIIFLREAPPAAPPASNVSVLVPKSTPATGRKRRAVAARPSARVLSMHGWLDESAEAADDLEVFAPTNLEELTIGELRARVGSTVFKRRMPKSKLVRMIRAVEAIAREGF